jgi:hypothetical protein
MRRSLRVIPLTFVFILIAAIQGNVRAQSPERYFPDTGYSVGGAFLDFYEDAPDPLLLFGYPISAEITGANGKVYQYFQRARFELIAGKEGPVVQLFPLGERLYQAGEPAPLSSNSPTCRRFNNGYSVCYSFIAFYDAYKGAVYFGDPISNVEKQDGRYVQYFENARMEWRANAGSEDIVSLTDLGALYLHNYDQEKASRPPDPGSFGMLNPVKLQARAFVAQPLISVGETQTVYVIAQDQAYQPVENAGVYISVYYPDGTQSDVRASSTNADGISQYTFQVDDAQVKEIVRIAVQVTYGAAAFETSTWFRSWW